MPRPSTLSPLRAYLSAAQSKPEEQATAVLAAGLLASPELTRLVLDRLRAPAGKALSIDTEVLTGLVGTADKVDLELYVQPAGDQTSRVWVEAKLTAPFAQANPRTGLKHQMVRYRDALSAYDARRLGDGPRSTLGALVLRVRRQSDWRAISQSDTRVIAWQTVADCIGVVGVSTGGPDWREVAAGPDAPQSLACLETVLWYLEDKVGVTANQPLVTTDLQLYSDAQRVIETVGAMAARVCDLLQERHWRAIAAKRYPDEPLTVGGTELRPPGRAPWWTKAGARQGTLQFQIAPYDQRTFPAGPTPTIWVGLEFKKAGRFTSSWIERLRASGLVPEEDKEGSGLVAYVGIFEELSVAIGEASDGGAQATAVRDWIVQQAQRVIDAGGVGSSGQAT